MEWSCWRVERARARPRRVKQLRCDSQPGCRLYSASRHACGHSQKTWLVTVVVCGVLFLAAANSPGREPQQAGVR